MCSLSNSPFTLLLLSCIGPASPYTRSQTPNTNGSTRSPLLVLPNLQSGQVRKVSDPLQQKPPKNHRLGFFFLRSQSISVKPSFWTHLRRHGSLFLNLLSLLQFPFVDFIDNFVCTGFVNFDVFVVVVLASRRLHRSSQKEIWVPPWSLRAQAQEGSSWSPQALSDCPEGPFLFFFLTMFLLNLELNLSFFFLLINFWWGWDCGWIVNENRLWVLRARCLPRSVMLRRLRWRKREWFCYCFLYFLLECVWKFSLLMWHAVIFFFFHILFILSDIKFWAWMLVL